MFESRGWEASSWRRLSPNLKTADTIVWAPDSFSPPSDEQIDWIETWMSEDVGRTLVFIGRDYDAAPAYWRQIKQSATPEDASWINEEAAQADYVAKSDRRAMNDPAECRWFSFAPRKKFKTITSLDSDSGWAQGIDTDKLSIESAATVVAPTDEESQELEVLLRSGGSKGDLLAYRIVKRWSGDSWRIPPWRRPT